MKEIQVNNKLLRLYEAMIEGGVMTAADIARVTGAKRPTVYVRLEELVRAGLAERFKINRKTYFKPSDPKVLLDGLDHDRRAIEALAVTYREGLLQIGRPQTRILEGMSHVKELYKEIEQANSLRVWSNIGGIQHIFTDVYHALAEKIGEHKINAKEIIAADKASVRYAKYLRQIAGPTYSFRVSPSRDIENDTIIFGNCVAIFSLQGSNFFAVRIEDSSIAKTFRAIFDMAWRSL